jgi:hypothetical protein
MTKPIHPEVVKSDSEARITALGGRICEWLPWLDRSNPRTSEEAAGRTLAMHAMLQLYFGAPFPTIEGWIEENDLTTELSRRERALLAAGPSALVDQARVDLFWYLESLWALVWAGGLIADLPVEQPVGDELASLLPDLRRNEPGAGFRASYRLRDFEDLYRMLDLYYRAHWYARDGWLRSYDTKPFDLDVIMERRKALEWLADASIPDWDEAPDHT